MDLLKIEAFKLSDGRIIDNEERAIELQKEIDIKRKLSFLCEEYLNELEYYELADEIYSKRNEFLSALNGL
jgi:hypothetical protein